VSRFCRLLGLGCNGWDASSDHAHLRGLYKEVDPVVAMRDAAWEYLVARFGDRRFVTPRRE